MHKLFIFIMLIGLLAFSGTAIADDQARITFNSPTKIIQVYTFYDLKLGNLCYITENSIFCIPYHQLYQPMKSTINKLVRQTPNDIAGNKPDIIQIY